jgi:hypothetical protein
MRMRWIGASGVPERKPRQSHCGEDGELGVEINPGSVSLSTARTRCGVSWQFAARKHLTGSRLGRLMSLRPPGTRRRATSACLNGVGRCVWPSRSAGAQVYVLDGEPVKNVYILDGLGGKNVYLCPSRLVGVATRALSRTAPERVNSSWSRRCAN